MYCANRDMTYTTGKSQSSITIIQKSESPGPKLREMQQGKTDRTAGWEEEMRLLGKNRWSDQRERLGGDRGHIVEYGEKEIIPIRQSDQEILARVHPAPLHTQKH
ncbi:hypothetical protein PISMIDRAFT_17103 [Pisolithus microcarpus 441]|uniref:Uncharacterized protein n=1 Tax=Pisolithus microcarpus 441 TaxID=765257 RepID=A0A0C9XQY1_9AGAM|nr:hypothetical protein PISMIDRAFT_17103 [Pisolithus microcarpus 441]